MTRPKRAFVLCLLAAALTFCAPLPAAATWPHDPSLNLPVTSLPAQPNFPEMCPDGAGGAYLAWADTRNQISADLYLAHIRPQGDMDPAWPVNGVLVSGGPNNEVSPVVAADGAGGVFVAWQDLRAANPEIFLQRITSAGTPALGWPVGGMRLDANNTVSATQPQIASDGAGGAYVAWTTQYSVIDYDPFLTHITATGSLAVSWPFGGQDVDAAGTDESEPSLAPDGSGGAILAYRTNAAGNYDIKAVRYTFGHSLAWSVTVCNQAGDQFLPLATADGQGGALIAWEDSRGADIDVYANRVLSTGAVGYGWPGGANGTAIFTGAGNQYLMSITSDGSQGAYIADAVTGGATGYVQHVTVSGAPPTGSSWPPGGQLLSGSWNGVTCIADNSGGVIALNGVSSGTSTMDAVRFNFDGSLALGWMNPVHLTTPQNVSRQWLIATSDGSGGAIAVWLDQRSATSQQIYAQRIERFGQLGDPEPSIVNVHDVKDDQGGYVRLSWNASYLDAYPALGVAEYRVWRQAPSTAAAMAVRAGSAMLTDGGTVSARDQRRVFRATIESGQMYYWELVATQVAAQYPNYSIVAATTGDSTGSANPYTVFMVDAATKNGTPYWSSSPDSGYSVDNLPPVAPSPFSASYVPPNGTFVEWGANSETDLAGYRLYRGAGLNFATSPANRVYDGTATNYHDPTNSPFIYKICAYDIHGNEGRCATAQPSGTLSADSQIPRRLALGPVDPNPAHDGANLRLELPRGGSVRLTIYDAAGRRIRTLVNAWLPAGVATASWDGRDEAGDSAASGLYFARLDAEGQSLMQRFVRLQ
jgi:hypothetical protein